MFDFYAFHYGKSIKSDFVLIKQELAQLVGQEKYKPSPAQPRRQAAAPEAERDFSAIRSAWGRAGRDPTPVYLTQDRLIPRQVLTDARFQDTFRIVQNNVAFPYFGPAGEITGIERRWTPDNRNEPKASFSKGGKAGIWKSNSSSNDTALVVCKSPIDCMSYHFLNPSSRPTNRYVALRQGKEPAAALREVVRAMPKDAVVVGACDRGAAGEGYQKLIREIAREEGRRFVDHRSKWHKDWNDEMKFRAERAIELKAHLDRQAEAAAPTAAERPIEPAVAPSSEVEREAQIEELEDDDEPAPGM